VKKLAQIFGSIYTLLLACFFMWQGINGLSTDREFNENVGRTTGTIERFWMTSSGRGWNRDYWVTYNYQPGSDAARQITLRISATAYPQLHEGLGIPVKYLLRDPDETRIDWPNEEQWHWVSDVGYVILGIVLLAGAAFAAWCARPQSQSAWMDAAIKMEAEGKDRQP
jgi:hypothetical protein